MKQRLLRAFDIALIVTLLVVVVWTVRGYVVQRNFDDTRRAEVSSMARVSVDNGNGKPISGDVAADGTVLDAIRDFAAENSLAFETKTYPGMGILVIRVGDSKNGAGGAYWQYWMNGKYATSAADSVAVHPGDSIEWKFSDSAQ